MLHNTRKVSLPGEPSSEDVLLVTVLFNLTLEMQRISITFWGDKYSRLTRTVYDLSIYAEPEDPASQYIATRNIVWKLDDSTSYTAALKCIKDCARHESCPRPVPTTLPTRVLDCSDPSGLRLITTNPSTKELFVALSYVWGGPQLHCTTKDNIKLYRNFIDPSKVPKTIADAITVTRRLGLRYLWVDSFCIIQDSSDDKALEIAKMRLNFRNAFITIVAARANAVSEGFLQNTYPTLQFAPIRLPFRCPNGNTGTFTAVRHMKLTEPVDSRAWCLEERVLSPRLLVFSTGGLQYECQTERINVNRSPLGLPWTVTRLPDYAFVEEPGIVAELQMENCWNKILQQYTASSLTNQKDKLLAIAGIAEQLHRLWPESRYVAGLWTHQLPSALLWKTEQKQIRPNIYRAPSWSWAAVDGPITPGKATWESESAYLNDRISEVKNIVVNLKHTTNPYGEITSAHLILCADLARATWNTHEDSDPCHIIFDELPAGGLMVAGRINPNDHIGYVGLDAVEIQEPRVVELMLVGLFRYGAALPVISRLGKYDIHGLVLLPALDQDANGVTTYRRIGEFTMNAENWFPFGKHDVHII
ncbi:heterokaryon incompatibility protein-domain-containing protein [Collybia nuda]|uniref:Heterokaryon incompatibility protein-domain-containing protein n=1 Tax=Collybia nuda TaxID=64659 RepID=A0A9P5Y663_9AGAR|nr:heterokaryon incompatibility protein-domain-containing protein [Collybia nuda]